MTKELSSIIFEIYSFDWSFLYQPEILKAELIVKFFYLSVLHF